MRVLPHKQRDYTVSMYQSILIIDAYHVYFTVLLFGITAIRRTLSRTHISKSSHQTDQRALSAMAATFPIPHFFFTPSYPPVVHL